MAEEVKVETVVTPAAQEAAPAAAPSPATSAVVPAAPVATEKPAEAPVPEAPKAPEKYDLKLPEGVKLPKERIEAIEARAKERGLSQEDAQGLVDLEVGAAQAARESDQAAFEAVKSTWIKEVELDPEIGGSVENSNRTAEAVKRVTAKYGSEKLKQNLEASGYGNYPEFARFCRKVFDAIGPDKLITPTSQSGSITKSREEKFYDKTKE